MDSTSGLSLPTIADLFEEVYDEVASETCLGYLPHSEEIAGTVLFFASPLATPVTGQMIGVNAGHWFNG